MNVLIYGDTESSPALRHELPVRTGDPFLYFETDGRRAVVTNVLEEARIAQAAPEVERLLAEEFGRDELIAAGHSLAEVNLEVCARAAAAASIRSAAVPPDFPLALGDRLRASGIELNIDEQFFDEHRRHKTGAEIAGIRRASDAAMRAMGAAKAMLGEAEIRRDQLWHAGELLTAEGVRARIREVCGGLGAPATPDLIVKAMGPEAEIGHSEGFGPLPANTPVVIDLWPRDEQSGCWADMTRTFVRGEVGGRLAELHALVMGAHQRACESVRAGVEGAQIYGLVCDLFEAAGHPTLRTKRPGETLRDGFYYSLGHSVGLQVHEAPVLGRSGTERLIAGDVIAIEPGLAVRSLGGVNVEDLLIVTDDGSENLTGGFSHQLAV